MSRVASRFVSPNGSFIKVNLSPINSKAKTKQRARYETVEKQRPDLKIE